jgi:hypothetical protein
MQTQQTSPKHSSKWSRLLFGLLTVLVFLPAPLYAIDLTGVTWTQSDASANIFSGFSSTAAGQLSLTINQNTPTASYSGDSDTFTANIDTSITGTTFNKNVPLFVNLAALGMNPNPNPGDTGGGVTVTISYLQAGNMTPTPVFAQTYNANPTSDPTLTNDVNISGTGVLSVSFTLINCTFRNFL